MQNRTFDPGGSQGCLRACLVLESWRALLCGEVVRVGATDDELQRFLGEIRCLFEAKPALKMPCKKKQCRLKRLGATGGTNGGHAVNGSSR